MSSPDTYAPHILLTTLIPNNSHSAWQSMLFSLKPTRFQPSKPLWTAHTRLARRNPIPIAVHPGHASLVIENAQNRTRFWLLWDKWPFLCHQLSALTTIYPVNGHQIHSYAHGAHRILNTSCVPQLLRQVTFWGLRFRSRKSDTLHIATQKLDQATCRLVKVYQWVDPSLCTLYRPLFSTSRKIRWLSIFVYVNSPPYSSLTTPETPYQALLLLPTHGIPWVLLENVDHPIYQLRLHLTARTPSNPPSLHTQYLLPDRPQPSDWSLHVLLLHKCHIHNARITYIGLFNTKCFKEQLRLNRANSFFSKLTPLWPTHPYSILQTTSLTQNSPQHNPISYPLHMNQPHNILQKKILSKEPLCEWFCSPQFL